MLIKYFCCYWWRIASNALLFVKLGTFKLEMISEKLFLKIRHIVWDIFTLFSQVTLLRVCFFFGKRETIVFLKDLLSLILLIFKSLKYDFFVDHTAKLIEKVLINDRLRVSKASWKFRIPIIYYFATIYPWNLWLLICSKIQQMTFMY